MDQYKFTLSYNGLSYIFYDDEQPNGLSSLKTSIKRDFKSHGAFYQFNGSEINLEFIGGAREFLNNAWLHRGLNALVDLLIESRSDEFSEYVEVFSGSSIMKTRGYNTDFFICDFEEVTILTKITSRIAATFSTDKANSLDGIPMNAVAFDGMTLNPKILKEQSSVQLTFDDLGFQTLLGFPTWDYAVGAYSPTGKLNQIRFIQGGSAQVVAGNEGDFLPSVSDDIDTFTGLQFLSHPIIGEYSISLTASGYWEIVSGTSSTGVGIKIRWYKISDGSYVSENVISASALFVGVTTSATYSETFTVTIPAADINEGLFFRVFLEFGPTAGSASKNITFVGYCNLEATLNSEWPMTSTECLHIHESLRANLEYLTSEPALLYAPKLGRIVDGYYTNGELSDFVELNGYLARGFTRPVEWNLADRLKSLSNVLSLGWGIELNDDNELDFDYVVMTLSGAGGGTPPPINGDGVMTGATSGARGLNVSFYSSSEIKLYEITGKFQIGESLEHATGWSATITSIEYVNKWRFVVDRPEYFYQDVEMMEIGDIEMDSYEESFAEFFDFSTIKVGYNKYAKASEGASLNDFNTQHEYNEPLYYMTSFNSGGNRSELDLISDYIGSDYLLEEARRKSFDIQGDSTSENDNDIFLVNVNGDEYDGGYVQLPTSVCVDTISGLDNSETSFNLLINPKYNLINHGWLINSSFFSLPLTESIRNTQALTNKALTFKYKGAFSPSVGDLQRRLWTMDDDILIGELNYGRRLFDPILIKFKTAFSASGMNTFILGHRNGLPSGNYGYLSVTNPDGEVKTGWLLNADFSLVDKIVTITMIQRNTDYGLL